MKEYEFLDGLSHIESDVVERFVSMENRLQRRANRSKGKRAWMRVGAVAACLAVIVGAVLILLMMGMGVPGIFDPPFEQPIPGGNPSGDATPPLYSSFNFDSYEGMIEGFENGGLLAGSDTIQGIKDSMGEHYAEFVDKVNADGGFLHPMLGGQPIPYQNKEGFSNITFFPSELYGMPWIWYHCLVEGERVNIQITYPACLGIEIDHTMDASAMLKTIAPNAVNVDNFKDRPTYEAVYLQNIPMATGEVSVLVYELKDRIMYTFFMGEAMVIVTDYQGVMLHKLWKQFSVGMEELLCSAEGSTLLREGKVARVSLSSLPAGYTHAFAGEDAQAIVDYLSDLNLISDFPENPNEYDGMTWVISLAYDDGSTRTVYHFGNMFIRAEDGPWYKMSYDEASCLNELLAELHG